MSNNPEIRELADQVADRMKESPDFRSAAVRVLTLKRIPSERWKDLFSKIGAELGYRRTSPRTRALREIRAS